MTPQQFSHEAVQQLLKIYDEGEARALCRVMLREMIPGYNSAQDLTVDQQQILSLALSRLIKGEPLQYILGYTWFHDLKIAVNPSVLIPRPETEELLSLIKNEFDGDARVMLDCCCGSGCIALVLKKFFAEASVYACDFSLEALATARKNSDDLNLAVNYYWADVLDEGWLSSIEPTYNLIVSNPPYIMRTESATMHENVLRYEPSSALFTGDDPLIFYKAIGEYARQALKPSGELWFEIHAQRSDHTALLLEAIGFGDVRIYPDLSGNDRFIRALI